MNTRAFTLALVLSGIAMFMVWTHINTQKIQLVNRYGKEKPVVVAKVDIKELDLIDSKNLDYQLVPEQFVLPGYYEKIDELENTIATLPILKGEQITRPRVTYPGARGGLAREIAPGKRAMAVQVSQFSSVAGLVKPGDRIDVFAAVDYAGGDKEKQKMQLILQDILVLAVGREITNSIPIAGLIESNNDAATIKKMNLNTYGQYNSVTLELEPYEAQKLAYVNAYSTAGVTLALRNNIDKKRENLKATQIYDVLNEEDRGIASEYFRERNKR